MYQNGIKIVLDKIVALLAILLLSPIFILITLLLLFLQKQVFFIQTRIGKNKTRFSIYKFLEKHLNPPKPFKTEKAMRKAGYGFN